MSWVRLDDGFPDNAKVENLSDRAFRLYITGLCLSARKLTDGRLNRKDLAVLLAHSDAKKQHVSELEEAGLWRLEGDTATINDYLTYNPPRDKVEARRNQAKSRMQGVRSHVRSRERSREQDSEQDSERASERAQHVRASPAPAPTPVMLSADKHHAADRLMSVLGDADELTETIVRRLIQKHRLSIGDIEYARECAMGPGVRSPAAVAVAELMKRAEAAA